MAEVKYISVRRMGQFRVTWPRVFSFPVLFLQREVSGGGHYFNSCHITFIGLYVIYYHNIRLLSNRSSVLVGHKIER
jgi:hypothetical protein